MKLLSKTSLIYLCTTLLVFAAGGSVFYYNLRELTDEETTEALYLQKSKVLTWLEANDTIPIFSCMGNQLDEVKEQQLDKEIVLDTAILVEEEDELLPYRVLTFPAEIKGKSYAISVSRPLFEQEDLVESILYSFIVIAAALLLITLVVNRIASARIMRPFFKTLEQLDQYEMGKTGVLKMPPSSTNEFKRLGNSLEKMTARIDSDYNSLKAFTENASHEMQTPLAVILNSCENLLQNEGLNQKQAESVERLSQSARKLSRLNQDLLLLAKISNGQYLQTEKIDFATILQSKLELYEDLFAVKSIQVQTEIVSKPKLLIHPSLAEILISNLISNAIRYSPESAKVAIKLTETYLEISNEGKPLESASEKLFERFYKENASSASTGLGLALVKQIGDSCGLTIAHAYRQKKHFFIVHFSEK
jgi:two-component system, OmpR family, sensor histidine kinase QseC